jgi:hypothetical protein
MAPQPKQSAELLCPFRQTLLPDAYQGRAVMGHHRHAQLHRGTLKTFVTHVTRTARE